MSQRALHVVTNETATPTQTNNGVVKSGAPVLHTLKCLTEAIPAKTAKSVKIATLISNPLN